MEVEDYEMRAWGEENLPHVSDASEEAKDVLGAYQSTGHMEMNYGLRTMEMDEIRDEVVERIEILDDALEPLGQEMRVFRGGSDLPDEMWVPGTEFIDDAFVSTSLDQSASVYFADRPTSKKAIFAIDVPPETRGIFMERFEGMDELEVLVERGLRFRVKEVFPGEVPGIDYGDIDLIQLEIIGYG